MELLHSEIEENKEDGETKQEVSIKSDIYFNYKAKEWYQLSNFYGGVEEAYASLRFPPLASLLFRMAVCSGEEFLALLKTLQPGKKWNTTKEKFWFDEKNQPIRGILAKLVMNAISGK